MGQHVLTVTPYSEDNAGGTAGTAVVVSFTVVDSVVEPPQTLAFGPNHDAYLESGKPFNNGLLKVEAGRRISYLRFNVIGLNGRPVTSAKLRLGVDTDPGSGTLRAFKGAHSDWTETTLTSSNAPAAGIEVGQITGSFGNNSDALGALLIWDPCWPAVC